MQNAFFWYIFSIHSCMLLHCIPAFKHATSQIDQRWHNYKHCDHCEPARHSFSCFDSIYYIFYYPSLPLFLCPCLGVEILHCWDAPAGIKVMTSYPKMRLPAEFMLQMNSNLMKKYIKTTWNRNIEIERFKLIVQEIKENHGNISNCHRSIIPRC